MKDLMSARTRIQTPEQIEYKSIKRKLTWGDREVQIQHV